MKSHEQARTARRRQRLLMGGIGIAALVLLSVGSLNSYRDLKAGRAQEADLSERIEETEARIDELEQRVESLREDPAMIEEIAREELMMARPGEVVVVLPAEGVSARPGDLESVAGPGAAGSGE